MIDLKQLVTFAKKKKASDIHLVAGAKPMLRIDGDLHALKKPALTKSDVESTAKRMLNAAQLKRLDEDGDVDSGVLVGKTALRANVHRQVNGLGIAIRLIPESIPSPDDILLPDIIRDAVLEAESGIIIVSGPAGMGKTTTLATMVQMLNEEQQKHVITLEDPIEYRFDQDKCLIEQRQLGSDFPTYASGLRHVLRQDPNVIVVGEMRDPETISLALTAAETGHLVLSTLHAPNATEVVERIVNVFEGAQQQQILVQFASTLRLVVAQRLVPMRKGGRVAAREILTPTHAVQNAIRQNKLSSIRSAIETGRKEGMISMKQALDALKKDSLID